MAMNLSKTLCLILSGADVASAFSSDNGHAGLEARRRGRSGRPTPPQARWRLSEKSERGSGDDEIIDPEGEDDWRSFRAKLVMSEGPTPSSQSTEGSTVADDSDLIGSLFSDGGPPSAPSWSPASMSGFTPLDPSQWAYDSGKVVERGAVILGGVEQDFGFGLRQQYFHKAVILVLDHDENTFTKGIILNRPSDRMMEDDVNEGVKWRVWFGGDVQGLDSLLPDIVCMHSLRSKEAKEASVTVMKDIQWTSFANAKKLVQRGIASGPEDFWLFAGYAGWGPRQLSGELDRKSWYMCATDSGTLLKELARQSRDVEPRDAGLETWELLMNMIGRGGTAVDCGRSFDDLMLKEWSQANLLKFEHGDVGLTKNPLIAGAEISTGTVDKLMQEAAKLALSDEIAAGTLLRGSSADRSPFLLQKQELHHSLVLVVHEDEKVSLGCMLNHPATKGYKFGGIEKETSSIIPIRYGGDYALKGQSPLTWLHCSKKLRDSGVGKSFVDQRKGIFKCTEEEATEAISYNIAKAEDFFITSGVCVWPKLGGSLANEVKRGAFEVVEEDEVGEIFQTLQKQDILTKETLASNIAIAHEAWSKGAKSKSSAVGDNSPPMVGIGQGFDEDDDSVVFNSEKKVSELADDALMKWIATFLLGAPTLI